MKRGALGLLLLYMIACGSVNGPVKAPVTTNKDVILPPAWAFGVLYGGYTNQEETQNRVDRILAQGYPIDAYWIDSWFWSYGDKGRGPQKYIDFIADTVAYPDRRAMWKYLEHNHIKGGFWIWDCIFKQGNEAAFDDFQKRGFFHDTYYEQNPWHNGDVSTAMYKKSPGTNGTLCGNINFKNPKAVAYFKQRMKHFFDEGADFVKLDRSSEIAVCKTMFELSQEFGHETSGRGFVMSHTDGMESSAYKRYPCKWTGDTRADWNTISPTRKFNPWVPDVALSENIRLFITPDEKTSLIPFLANDLGGFDHGLTDSLDEELYIRWMQFSFFTPVVEVVSQPENSTANLAYNYSSRADSLFRSYARLRMELFPYIYSYAHRVRWEGHQMMQAVGTHPDEYFFGDELLVAPVCTRGAKSRMIEFPEGEWADYYSGARYQGGSYCEVPAPITQIPLFVRQGSIIPRRHYAPHIETGNNDTLMLDVYANAQGVFDLYEDDGRSNAYLNGYYALTHLTCKPCRNRVRFTIGRVQGDYAGMKDNRVWQIRFYTLGMVKRIFVDGRDTEFTNITENNRHYALAIVRQIDKHKSIILKLEL